MLQRRGSKPVQRWLQPVRSDLQRLAAIRSPKSARRLLGLSERELGIEIAKRVPGRASPYSKSTINGWERHRNPITEDVRKAFGVLLANWISNRTGRDIGVTIKINSPWHVHAHYQCGCGRWFQMARADETRCKLCRGKRR